MLGSLVVLRSSTWLVDTPSLPHGRAEAEDRHSNFYDTWVNLFAWVLLDTLHDALTHPNLNTGQVSASLVNSCIANLARLGVCAADRARMGVILKAETTPDEKKAAIMANYRRFLQPASDAS